MKFCKILVILACKVNSWLYLDAEKIKNVIRAYLEEKTGGVESMKHIVEHLRTRFPQEQILKENVQELISFYPGVFRVVENTVHLVLSKQQQNLLLFSGINPNTL